MAVSGLPPSRSYMNIVLERLRWLWTSLALFLIRTSTSLCFFLCFNRAVFNVPVAFVWLATLCIQIRNITDFSPL